MKVLILVLAVLSCSIAVAGSEETPQEFIRIFIENKPESGRYFVDGEALYSNEVLPRFYVGREFETVWFTDNGILRKSGVAIIAYLQKIDRHGLRPADYHLEKIEQLVVTARENQSWESSAIMKTDLLLTDAFLLLGSHLSFGKVDPEAISANWKIQRNAPELKLDELLEKALHLQKVPEQLESLAPTNTHYKALLEAAEIITPLTETKWPLIVSDKSLRNGDDDPAVAEIRIRLFQLGYDVSDTTSTFFDDSLQNAIVAFQLQNGFSGDGVVGKKTIQTLNRQPIDYLKTIHANLERLRWMPDTLPDKFVWVNIADFKMQLIQNNDTLFETRAIVGKPYRKTPAFSASMSYLVFSPGWVIPPGILANDVLPELKKGPGYLNEKNMQILTSTGTEVSYSSIDWSNVSARNFRYLIRQRPGPQNALGYVKFMFPNPYSIYIHDTPTRSLFSSDARAFSSGCIRIENPLDFAELLLNDQPEWDRSRIDRAAKSGNEQTVRFKEAIPVILGYFTAWSDPSGSIQWREDIYSRDNDVFIALQQQPHLDNLK